ncbi:hypothetical protein ACLB2K_010194 [Fragaria x ananassa]
MDGVDAKSLQAAFDSYYQKQGKATGSCDFKGVATSTTTDPNSKVYLSYDDLLLNLHDMNLEAQRVVSSIRLNDVVEGENGSTSEVKEEEEMGEGADSAISSSIREDESRRNASLTPENGTSTTMRGISFAGVAPD